MKATRITNAEINELGVSSLPTRPCAPSALGGRGYTAVEMKRAFDRLPSAVAERFNLLMEDVEGVGENSLAGAIPTGISDGHTLSRLFSDLTDGSAAAYIKVMELPLISYLVSLREDLDRVMDTLGIEREG